MEGWPCPKHSRYPQLLPVFPGPPWALLAETNPPCHCWAALLIPGSDISNAIRAQEVPTPEEQPLHPAQLPWGHHLGCKRLLGSLSSAVNPAPPPRSPLNHIHTAAEHFQEWWLHQCSLCQLFATLPMKKRSRLSSLNLRWHNLRPFPLVLALVTWLPPGCFLL